MAEGVALLNQAQASNPNLAAAWFLGAFCHLLYGQTERAVEHFTRAMYLSPVDPELYRMQVGMAIAHYFLGDFAAAASWAETSIRSLPSLTVARAILAASQAMLGKQQEAQQTAAHLQELAPLLRLDALADWLPIRSRVNLALLSEGLAKAGFPS
ncbi:hypothetical protein [Tahibacter caeni]|uniref:hypothetical protein n=1 Tax=Tahibacter caeni TaxID=1453545 RepID=UPI002149963B|nr:hypothetical protein [Tahibacter caeni]